MESGLVNLKTELHKKKSQIKNRPTTTFAEEKSDFYESSKSLLSVKTDTPRPKFNKRPTHNNYSEFYDGTVKYRPDLYDGEEEDNNLQKSRYALEQKSLLYEKLKGGVATLDRDNRKERFLVDFEGKIPDKDYIAGRKNFLTKKWEKIEEETMQKEEMHFSDVNFDEARTLGVGHMRFSREESERRAQQDLLNNLRSETLTTADFRLQDKKRKEMLMKDRLRKVRDKKRLKLGLPMKDTEDDLLKTPPHSDEEKESIVEENKFAETPVASDVAAEIERKVRSIREWDLGKPSTPEVMSQGEWNENQRKVREDEFAPPTFYNKQSPREDGSRNKKWSHDQSSSSFGGNFNTNRKYEKEDRASWRDKKDIYKNIYNKPYEPADAGETIKNSNFDQHSTNLEYQAQSSKSGNFTHPRDSEHFEKKTASEFYEKNSKSSNYTQEPPINYENFRRNSKSVNFTQPSPNSEYFGKNADSSDFEQTSNSEHFRKNTKSGNFAQSPSNSEYFEKDTNSSNFEQLSPNSENYGKNTKLGNFVPPPPSSEYFRKNTDSSHLEPFSPNSENYGKNTKLGNFVPPPPNSEYLGKNTDSSQFEQPSPNSENYGKNTKLGNFTQAPQNSEYFGKNTDSSKFEQPSPNCGKNAKSGNFTQSTPGSGHFGKNTDSSYFEPLSPNSENYEKNTKLGNFTQPPPNTEFQGKNAKLSSPMPDFSLPPPNLMVDFSKPPPNFEQFGSNAKSSLSYGSNIPYNNTRSNPPTNDFQSPVARPGQKMNKKLFSRLSFAPKPDSNEKTLDKNDMSSQQNKISNYISNGLAFRMGQGNADNNDVPLKHGEERTGPLNNPRPQNMYNSPANNSGMNSNLNRNNRFSSPANFQRYGPNTVNPHRESSLQGSYFSIEQAIGEGLRKLRKEFDLKNANV